MPRHIATPTIAWEWCPEGNRIVSGYLEPFTAQFDLTLAAWVALGWIAAGAPMSYVIARFLGHDLLHEGASSAGFSAVSTALGKRIGTLAALADAVKAAALVGLAYRYSSFDVAGWTAVAVLLGYQWPLWLRFRGGRGLVIGITMSSVLGIWEAWIGIPIMLLSIYLLKDSAPGVFVGVVVSIVTILVTRDAGSVPTFALILGLQLLTHRVVGYRPPSIGPRPGLPRRLAAQLLLDRDTFTRPCSGGTPPPQTRVPK